MIVEIDSHKTTLSFNNMEIGEVFEYDGKYFLKTINVFDADRYYNAIHLSTGNATYFTANAEVVKVNAKLMVNY